MKVMKPKCDLVTKEAVATRYDTDGAFEQNHFESYRKKGSRKLGLDLKSKDPHQTKLTDLVLPQVFIDGLYVGDVDDVQGLEDDGLLEDLLLRKKCPSRNGKHDLCNADRVPGAMECSKCRERFDELLPG